MEKLYTIGDAAAELGMPASTIRFYEKNGLIPNQQRSSDGRRLFDEDDLEWMRFVERLKVSGMPIKEQLEELKLARDFIDYKCWYYDVARESGTCETPKNMPFDELPERIQRIKAKCRINRY